MVTASGNRAHGDNLSLATDWSRVVPAFNHSSSNNLEQLTLVADEDEPILLEESNDPDPVRVSQPTVNSEKYENGSIKVQRTVVKLSDDTFVADGPYKEYFPNEMIFLEGSFKEGKRVGEWSYFYDNGKKNRTMTYKNGLLDGEWEVFRPDGSLLMTESYENGKRSGKWLRYEDDGKQILREESYVDGLADGEWKIWYKTGKPRQSVHFKAGKKDGITIEWDEEGNKMHELNFSENLLDGVSTRWNKDGTKTEQVYEKGKIAPKAGE
jgi:antitoxin component YwqK of YwqJK toxin-antitoxin module